MGYNIHKVKNHYPNGDIYFCLKDKVIKKSTGLLWQDADTNEIWCLDTDFRKLGLVYRKTRNFKIFIDLLQSVKSGILKLRK